MTESVTGSCSCTRVPLPGCDATRTVPRTLLHHVLHDIESDAAPGDIGHGLLQAEARQEQELQQLAVAHAGRGFRAREIAPDDGVAQRSQIDASSIVGHDHLQHAGTVMRFQTHDALFRLAGGAPLVGQLRGRDRWRCAAGGRAARRAPRECRGRPAWPRRRSRGAPACRANAPDRAPSARSRRCHRRTAACVTRALRHRAAATGGWSGAPGCRARRSASTAAADSPTRQRWRSVRSSCNC